MKFTPVLAFLTATLLAISCEEQAVDHSADPTDHSNIPHFTAIYGTPTIDGSALDSVWMGQDWLPLDQLWEGTEPDKSDFKGRYKLAWDENNLYVLAEVTDDTLIDQYEDGLFQYWDDDCLEVFIDEDGSGGNHQYNHNAFAYHIALDGRVVDIAPDSSFQYYNQHCTTRRVSLGNVSTWEVAIRIYNGESYEEGGENVPKLLDEDKHMGFALAYCDNDHSKTREHFMGSIPIEGEDKNRAWIDASLFSHLRLSY
jgi:hypothetical protein